MENRTAAESFENLLEISDILMGPVGCPWDREQTLVSMRESILEEACEVIEAIDMEDDTLLVEELGDLLYNVIFFCKLGEREKRFTTEEVIQQIKSKLILRHPHVFGDSNAKTNEEVIEQWERIKKEEKIDRESLMDGIPQGLPALARAYKVASKMDKAQYVERKDEPLFTTEDELGALLWEVVQQARQLEINPEMALRKEMLNQEREFRRWEGENSSDR